MNIITNLFASFEAGKKLTNSRTWNNAQLRVSLLVTLISTGIWIASFFGYQLELTVEEITQIAIGIGIVGGLLNGGTTVATTTELGVPARPISQPRDIGATTPVVVPAPEPKPEPKPDLFHDRSLG